MGLLVRALTYYAWYVAVVSLVFSVVLSVLYLFAHIQKRLNLPPLKVLQVLRRRSGFE